MDKWSAICFCCNAAQRFFSFSSSFHFVFPNAYSLPFFINSAQYLRFESSRNGNSYFRSKNLNQKSIAGEYVVEKENRALKKKKSVYRRESGRKSPSPLIYSKPSYSCSQRRFARRDSRALRFLSSFAILSDFSSCCSRSSSRRAIRSAIRSSSSMSSMPASISDDPSDA